MFTCSLQIGGENSSRMVSLCWSNRGPAHCGGVSGGRVQGSFAKGRPSGPSLLTFPRNVMTTFLCTNSDSGCSQIWWQVPLIVFTSLYFWHAPSVSLPRVFDAQWSTFSTPTYTYKLMCKRPLHVYRDILRFSFRCYFNWHLSSSHVIPWIFRILASQAENSFSPNIA